MLKKIIDAINGTEKSAQTENPAPAVVLPAPPANVVEEIKLLIGNYDDFAEDLALHYKMLKLYGLWDESYARAVTTVREFKKHGQSAFSGTHREKEMMFKQGVDVLFFAELLADLGEIASLRLVEGSMEIVGLNIFNIDSFIVKIKAIPLGKYTPQPIWRDTNITPVVSGMLMLYFLPAKIKNKLQAEVFARSVEAIVSKYAPVSAITGKQLEQSSMQAAANAHDNAAYQVEMNSLIRDQMHNLLQILTQSISSGNLFVNNPDEFEAIVATDGRVYINSRVLEQIAVQVVGADFIEMQDMLEKEGCLETTTTHVIKILVNGVQYDAICLRAGVLSIPTPTQLPPPPHVEVLIEAAA